MSCRKNDLAGKVIGRLTVLDDSGRRDGGSVIWRCRCTCGNEIFIPASNLTQRHTESCGCLRRAWTQHMGQNNTRHGHCRTKMSRTYQSWRCMLRRCTKPAASDYPRYGALGVTVCERWQKFENFLADMGERPDDTTLGRVLDMGNYEPGNAFWQTPDEQKLAQQNKRALLKRAAQQEPALAQAA